MLSGKENPPTTYPNFMASLNALARTRFEIVATSRRNCRAYGLEKDAPSLQNQAVSVAQAAEEQHVTTLAVIIASRCGKPLSLWMSESPVWLIRHQPTQAGLLRVSRCHTAAGVREVCGKAEAPACVCSSAISALSVGTVKRSRMACSFSFRTAVRHRM